MQLLPVKPNRAGLFRVHPIVIQKKPDHFVVSIPGSDDQRSRPLSGELGHVAQQVLGFHLRVVEQQRGECQDSTLACSLIHVTCQRLHLSPTGSQDLRFFRN